VARQLNEQVRERVFCAAAEVFAEAGYQGATMAAIATRAGVSTGNIYRYFEHKDALFYAVLPDEFAARFLRLTRRRVQALARAPLPTELDADAEARAEELLRFWIEHRLQVITLLDRAQGSRHEAFAETFVRELMRPTLAKLRVDAPHRRVSPIARFVLQTIFRNTVRTIVSILDAHADEAQIRKAFQGFWSYQLAGLSGFAEWVQS
jgi:AcrR family transcriptional regulator